MKTHLLLIGFSCTGKTSLGEKAFGKGSILDSDEELRKWIENTRGENFARIFKIFMNLGRNRALDLIAEAEKALIDKWTRDHNRMIISLGPGFPLHENWARLRAISHVVLFRRTPNGIYKSFMCRRKEIFECCPEAKDHDNWDVDVIVDAHRNVFAPEVAIGKIRSLLAEREKYYGNNDTEVVTDNREDALKKLEELKIAFEKGQH